MGWKPMLHANSKGQVIWWGNLSLGFLGCSMGILPMPFGEALAEERREL
jgi:hypothetical protein